MSTFTRLVFKGVACGFCLAFVVCVETMVEFRMTSRDKRGGNVLQG